MALEVLPFIFMQFFVLKIFKPIWGIIIGVSIEYLKYYNMVNTH